MIMGVEDVVSIFEVERVIYGERDGLGIRLGGFWDPIHD